MTVHLSLSVSISHQQKLLVGDFPHELEADDMDEDVPKRKNRTKARVRKHLLTYLLMWKSRIRKKQMT